ncbi:MAG TPA: hypothetical protein VJ692_16510 [Nitrospiraceae bacterium]|nr:hypothetical protein [Nitrospiraceae bacterium]
MTRLTLRRLVILTVWVIAAGSTAHAVSEPEGTHPQLLHGDRVLLGTVEEVASDQARINTGEVQPRFIPMNVRKAKGLADLKKGDRVEVTVNDQNLLVDVHLLGEASHHRVVQGQLVGPLETGHDKAVIRTTTGTEESHFVRPVARSKAASIPVGVEAVFLIDELDQIVDVTFGGKEAVHRAAELWQKKTPLKGNLNQVRGVVLQPLDRNTIGIRADDGNEQSYEVRPLALQRLAQLSKGDAVVLMVDDENKVTDVAFVPIQK